MVLVKLKQIKVFFADEKFKVKTEFLCLQLFFDEVIISFRKNKSILYRCREKSSFFFSIFTLFTLKEHLSNFICNISWIISGKLLKE